MFITMVLQIDRLSRTPIYEQIVVRFTEQVAAGLVSENERLPSVRELSVSLGINPNTIQKAYLELDRRGLITSLPGRGSFVSKDAAALVKAEKLGRLDELTALAKELYAAGATEEDLVAAVKNAIRKDENV